MNKYQKERHKQLKNIMKMYCWIEGFNYRKAKKIYRAKPNFSSKIRAKIISAFPGCGKSYFTNKYASSMVVLDSDSSEYSWVKDVNGNNTKERNPDFPNNYMRHIKENMDKADIIFVSSHDVVRKALADNNIEYTSIYPAYEEGVKEDFLERYRKRGSTEAFIDFMDNNWYKFVYEMQKDKSPKIKIELVAGAYITPGLLSII